MRLEISNSSINFDVAEKELYALVTLVNAISTNYKTNRSINDPNNNYE